ncbi:MAG: amino acid permease [Pseudomonadota bacterium]
MISKAPDIRPIHQAGTLGTFAGVFTPSILTILGIILFLRLGYVVGNAGLLRALIIIALANAISVLTSISLSAIATNIKIKGGGDYYLISRTLGLEFGGAIGTVLFLAQSVSVAFYCIGFGEAVAGMLQGSLTRLPQIIASFAVAFLFIFAWLGADWATKFQYLVMAILASALVSFFAGGLFKWDAALFAQSWTAEGSGLKFWILFAIFFPAVTGFTQGVSMSGDLKEPGRSLPVGIFLAVGVSVMVYFGVALVFAGAMPGKDLASDYDAMKRVARFGFLIDAGVIAATLSSAMASFLGGPRILQSMAKDRIFPFLSFFAQGSGPTNNPRRGVLLTAGIAFATIALGNLNLVAPVVSMFFLVSYGLLNYATYYEARAASPSFRPRFRWFHRRLSLLGGITCLGVILAINLAAGAVAMAVLFAIYQYLRRTAGPARWADSRRSYHLQLLREHLFAVAAEEAHPRDWRPQLLAFSNHAERREQLLRFASWLEGGTGLTTAVKILEGEGPKMVRLKGEAEKELRSSIKELGINAFPLVIVAAKMDTAVQTMVQAFGIGPLRANIILLNWLDEFPRDILGLKELTYGRNLRTVFRLGCNIVILNAGEGGWVSVLDRETEKRIDVWWWDDSTCRLMLLLAYLMTRAEAWEGATIRVLAGKEEAESEKAREALAKTLEEVRIEAEPKVLESISSEAVVTHSHDASLVFLPFRIKAKTLADPFGDPLENLLSHLPAVALVLAAEDIGLDAEPEEGKVGEIAEALDTLNDARKVAKETEKAAAKAAEEAEKKTQDIASAISKGNGEDIMAKVKEAMEAKDLATMAARKAAKAMAKAQDAAREAELIGADIPKEQEGAADNGKRAS